MIFLFAYGLQALWRLYVTSPTKVLSFDAWKTKASLLERRWVWGCAAFFGISVLGWLLYAGSSADLVKHLASDGVAMQGEPPEGVAREVARHSRNEVLLYLVVLALSMGVMWLFFSGRFSGGKQSMAAAVLGLFVAADLSRANIPWIQHYDYQARYAANPLTDFLSKQPSKSRVTVAPFGMPQLNIIRQLYNGEWMQQQFPYYNIPSINVVQEPRALPENVIFREALAGTNILRLWELTSTRYIVALADPFPDMLNQQLDGGRNRFKQGMGFALTNGTGPNGIAVVKSDTGPYAVVEFSGALPRANFYTSWTPGTSDENVLKRVADPGFNPAAETLVAESIAAPAASNAPPGKVEMVSYSPKRIELRTDSASPGIVMLTDKHDPNWKVTVDGQSADLLRCNFLFRGVQTPAGQHSVIFEFKPDLKPTWITSSAVLLAVVLSIVVWVQSRRDTGALLAA
ncbi:MAG: YfhO family protein [Verrucomicrobia bacterium]|nr:YfhO family protein [Verrucomicrobiota bacterium]